MQQKPVIFLAFANDREDNARYLRNVPAELSGIRDALQKAKRAGLCEVVERANVTIKQLLDTFQEYGNRIAVFHYGGHADGYQLLLETLSVVENANSGLQQLSKSAIIDNVGNSLAHGEGLVSFLAKQKGLQLIFFNGCSTERQAQELAAAGIPAVIGTNNAINDQVATDLAIRFYNGIAEQKTIAKAYQEAIDEIKIKKGGNVRGLYRKEAKEEEIKDLPCEIFYHPQKGEKAKHWQLCKDRKPLIFTVLTILLLLSAYPLYRYFFPPQPFSYTVAVKEVNPNPNLPFQIGKVHLQYGNKNETLDLIKMEAIFKGIPPNFKDQEVKIRFEAEGFQTIDSAISLENNIMTLPIQRDNSLGKIFGVVKDSNNQPLDSARISLQDISVYTDETGKFELNIPYPKQLGKQRLTAFKKGYEFWDYETPITNEEVKIILNSQKQN